MEEGGRMWKGEYKNVDGSQQKVTQKDKKDLNFSDSCALMHTSSNFSGFKLGEKIMKKIMKNLILIQGAYIDGILAIREYGRRSSKYGKYFLNRKAMPLSALRRKFRTELEKLGYTDKEISTLMQDAEDMAILEAMSEE